MTFSNLTYMMSMVNPIAISVKSPTIDNGYYLEKEFIELIRMNL